MIINEIEFDTFAVVANLKRLTNQVYKLLPGREEQIDWETPLTTIIEEFSGMAQLLPDQQETLFSLLCKLKGLFELTDEDDFSLYRRIIFDCLNLISNVRDDILEREGF